MMVYECKLQNMMVSLVCVGGWVGVDVGVDVFMCDPFFHVFPFRPKKLTYRNSWRPRPTLSFTPTD